MTYFNDDLPSYMTYFKDDLPSYMTYYYTPVLCRSDFTMEFNGVYTLSIIIISSPDRCCPGSMLAPDWLMDV